MKILIIHNNFIENGGEDVVVDSEIKMLKSFGHEVIFYQRSNKQIEGLPFLKKVAFAIREIIYSRQVYNEVKLLAKKERPDIAHIHNIFFRITPSVYYALKEEGVFIVQTLHNYRFICANGVMYRRGKRCMRCVGAHFLHAVINGCWKNLFFTLCLARILATHYKRETFQKNIDAYIALSEFSKDIFARSGFPEDKIYIKPNFADLDFGERDSFQDFVLFVGRLVDYKGVDVLLEAFMKLNFLLKMIGDGPLYNKLNRVAKKRGNLELLGRLPFRNTIEHIRNSSFVVFPTECYESTPRVIIESFACGVPVIASDIGGINSIVNDNITGLLFEPSNSADLAKKIKTLIENRDLNISMGKNAHKTYKERFTLEKNYQILIKIYESRPKRS